MATVTLNDNAFLTTCPASSVTTTQIPTGYTTVELTPQEIEHLHNKTLMNIQIPISPNLQPRKGGSEEPKTWLVDLGRIKETIKIKGILADEATTSAYTKKQNLETIYKNCGTFTVVWGTGSTQEKYTVNILQSSVKITPMAVIKSNSPPTSTPVNGYDVQLALIVGTDRGG